MLSTFNNSQLDGEKLAESNLKSMTILSYLQITRLKQIMDEMVYIHGRGNFPTLEVHLCDLVSMVHKKLCAQGSPVEVSVEQSTSWWPADDDTDIEPFQVKNIRMNGGAASYVLSTNTQPYNDLDLIFNISLQEDRDFDRIKLIVLKTLVELLPEGVNRTRMTPITINEAYVSKMVKVNNASDKWSLISLGTLPGQCNVELKFVDNMKRQFEFSVDSFQICLDSWLLFNERSEGVPMNEDLYPEVIVESVYGDITEAMYHLQNKLIVTRSPEEIRGGGLLKFCNLMLRGFKADCDSNSVLKMKQSMCSRFFIDFQDLKQQRSRLQSYLANHFFVPRDKLLKFYYLKMLKEVIEECTMNMMVHERKQILKIISDLLSQVKIEYILFYSAPEYLPFPFYVRY